MSQIGRNKSPERITMKAMRAGDVLTFQPPLSVRAQLIRNTLQQMQCSSIVLGAAIALAACRRDDSPKWSAATDCEAIDGDTIKCQVSSGSIGTHPIRLRLNGIDAPEMADPSGAGILAARSMSLLVDSNSVVYYPFKLDHYGRTVAEVMVGGTDLSCQMLTYGQAAYIARWDEQRVLASSCKGAKGWHGRAGLKAATSTTYSATTTAEGAPMARDPAPRARND